MSGEMDALFSRVLARKLKIVMLNVDLGKQHAALYAMRRKRRCCNFLVKLHHVLETYQVMKCLLRMQISKTKLLLMSQSVRYIS